ncbi:MAG: FHA domain-containing protein [Sedimentisphaerales bacterium]|nr:FHA domain-containing protein [Sedimentisphaerales bacterium]
MRLLIKRGYSLVNDLRFEDGPIYIGRRPQCQVFIPDRNVSRQHAVIYTNSEGVWMVQDLESANRTTVNGRPISKMPIHEGDCLGVADFTIEVHFEPEVMTQPQDQPIDLSETVVGAQINIPSVYQTTRRSSQNLRLSAEHLQNFYKLNLALANKKDQEELLSELISVLLSQLQAYHVWAGLRETNTGPLTCYGGCSRGGEKITLDQLFGKAIVQQAMKDETYILLPNIADITNPSDSNIADLQYLRSAMAAPIVAPAGAYGVIYVDNGVDQDPYVFQDLDYLTLVSTQIAATVEHIG